MAMRESDNLSDNQNFLVKPYERLPFVILFVGVMTLGTQGIDWLLSQIVSLEPMDTRQGTNPDLSQLALMLGPNSINYAAVAGLIGGAVTGVLQWILIRPYAPSASWIPVTCGGIVISSLISALRNQYALSFYSQGNGVPNRSFVVSLVLWFLLGLSALLLRYYAQARILKSYAPNSNLWVLVPIISGLVLAAHTLPIAIAQILNPLVS